MVFSEPTKEKRVDPEREAENEELRYLPDSEVEDEDLKAYKRFGVG